MTAILPGSTGTGSNALFGGADGTGADTPPGTGALPTQPTPSPESPRVACMLQRSSGWSYGLREHPVLSDQIVS